VENAVRSKGGAGECATEREVIRDGAPVLTVRDRSAENWLRGEVAETYDALKIDRSQVVSIEKVRAQLASAHGKVISAPKT